MMKTIRINWIVLYLILGFSSLAFSQSAKQTLDKEIEKVYKESNLHGFTVSIVNNEGVAFHKSYGYANVAQNKVLQVNHTQSIASVSKTFLGMALMKAQEMELLSLDSDINDYLPIEIKNPNFPSKKITIRHLATHMSSIHDKIKDFEKIYFLSDPRNSGVKLSMLEKFMLRKFQKNKNRPFSEFIKEIFDQENKKYSSKVFGKYAPGEEYKYSNVGTAIAGWIIELQSGMSYEKFVEQHILSPLNIQNAGFDIRQIPEDLRTTNYLNQKPLPEFLHLLNPGGGLIISNEDLSNYLIEVIRGFQGNGKLLHQDSYRKMFEGQLNEELGIKQSSNEVNQGIFWTHRNDGLIGHTGGGLGNNSFLFFDPQTGTGKIFLTNCDLENNKDSTKHFVKIWSLMKQYESTL